MKYFTELDEEDKTEVGAKAKGFLSRLRSFNFFFYCKIFLKLFNHLDLSNTAVQSTKMTLGEAQSPMRQTKTTWLSFRETFQEIWQRICEDTDQLGIDKPSLPRKRKIPIKLGGGGTDEFIYVESYFRMKYIEVVDNMVEPLQRRFESRDYAMCIKGEEFVLKGGSTLELIVGFGDDFDWKRLSLHRDMMFDILMSQEITIDNLAQLKDQLLLNNRSKMFPELTKFIRLLLTLPVTSCSVERSFSALKRLKTYLRSTMLQQRLNHCVMLNIYKEDVRSMSLEPIVDEFISKNLIRRNAFSLTNS